MPTLDLKREMAARAAEETRAREEREALESRASANSILIALELARIADAL